MAADDYGVVVGIADYPGLSDLQGPVLDAEAFHEWLTKTDGGGVPAENCSVILSERPPPSDRGSISHPDLGDIQTALDEIQDRGYANDGRAGRRLWLYVAGHGVAPNVGDAALVMANAKALRMYHLPTEPYIKWFRASAMFDEVVVIA